MQPMHSCIQNMCGDCTSSLNSLLNLQKPVLYVGSKEGHIIGLDFRSSKPIRLFNHHVHRMPDRKITSMLALDDDYTIATNHISGLVSDFYPDINNVVGTQQMLSFLIGLANKTSHSFCRKSSSVNIAREYNS